MVATVTGRVRFPARPLGDYIKSPSITQIDKYYLTEVGLMWYNVITIKPMLTEIQRKGDYYGKDL